MKSQIRNFDNTNTVINTILEGLYPVGSVYMSMNNSMPDILTQSMTWTPITAGYALVTTTSVAGGTLTAAGNTGSTVLNINQIPSHNHAVYFKSNTVSSGSGTYHLATPSDNSGNTTTGSAGGNQGHTHTAGMPANVAVYLWQRTA